MKYAVGQVLYVVLKKELRVYPMQVIEEITKKTLEGEVTSYMVRGGTDPKAQLLITEVDGEIFDSAERAKTVLIERATASISRMIDVATQKAAEWYPNSFEAPADDPIALLKKQPGTPVVAPPLPKQPKKKGSPVDDLKAELAAEADQGLLPIGPDGQTAKVRSVKLPDGMQ